MQAYILSKTDLKVKHAGTLVSYEINEDAASAAQSGFGFASAPNAAAGDYILLRGMYTGIISGVETDKKTSAVTLRALPVSSIFSKNILLGSAEAITENYILSTIDDNFVSSGDALTDIPYIAAAAITQTALGITPHNDNGIYNLDTFLRYVANRHHIFTYFEITTGSLNVSIENRIPACGSLMQPLQMC